MRRLRLKNSIVVLSSTIGLFCLMGIGCNFNEPKPAAGFDEASQEIIFDKCINCHAGGNAEGNLSFIDDSAALVKAGYIVPGEPDQSRIYQKIQEDPQGGDRMPKGGPYLNEGQIASIYNWILNFGNKVTITASNATVSPEGVKRVGDNETLSVEITVADGLLKKVTGTCPVGEFDGNTWTTGPITEDCELIAVGYGEATVTPVAKNATVEPATAQTVQVNTDEDTASFTVANGAGRTVGGTCPEGTWSGSVYTTGKVLGDCSVAFTVEGEAAVTGIGQNITLSPSEPQIVSENSTVKFTMTIDQGYDLAPSVVTTCTAGSFDGTTSYTTGAITGTCTVTLKGETNNPCPSIVSNVKFSTDIAGLVSKYGCTGCHEPNEPAKAIFAKSANGAADYTYIVEGYSMQNTTYQMINTSDAVSSLFYTKITENPPVGGKMPQGGVTIDGVDGSYPTLDEQNKVCNWIYDGALNN